MADERPEEKQRSDEPGPPATPLISQDELDEAVAEAQESARRAREAAKVAPPPAPPSAYKPELGPPIALPPDRGILSQDELDQAALRHAEDRQKPTADKRQQPVEEPADPTTDAEAVNQDEIDLLLRSVHNAAGSAPTAAESSAPSEPDKTFGGIPDVITQEELDGAMAEAEDTSRRQREESKADTTRVAAEPFREPPAIALPPDLGTISQDELDQVVQQHAEETSAGSSREQHVEPVSTSTPEETGLADQDEIDRMLKAVSDSDTAPTEDEESGAEDTAPPSPEEATAEQESASISQDEIDRMLKAVSDSDTTPAGDEESGAEDAAPPSREEAMAEPDDSADLEYGQVEQDAIDRLIREATEQAAAGGPAMGATHGEPADSDVAKSESPPEVGEAEAAEAESFAQNDIDPLLASLTAAPETGETTKTPEGAVTPSEGQPVPVDNPPLPEDTAEESERLGQDDLDQLIAGITAEESLNNQDLDEPLTNEAGENGADMEAEVVPKASADPQKTPDTQAPPAEDPVERATRGAAESEVGSENLAAAVPQADALLESIIAESGNGAEQSSPPVSTLDDAAIPSPDELSHEIADGSPKSVPQGRDDMVVQLGDEELAEMDLQGAAESNIIRKDFRRSLLRDLKKKAQEYVRSGSLKTWGSLAAGVLCTVATFLYLQSNQQRMPDMGLLSMPTPSNIDAVVRSARELIAMKEHEEARALLEPVVVNAQPGPSLAEAQCLYIESRYRQLPMHPTDREAESLHRDIDELVSFAPAFYRNPELLRWKASLYERSGALAAALSTYKLVSEDYADKTGGDETLIEAARLAGAMKRPEESEQFLMRLLQRFPASAYAPEAKLLLGDAQRDAGLLDDARKLYTQVALSQDFSPVGAEATARLAELELDQGNYDQAIANLEHRLETATTVEGNDAIYLLLAKAYRGNGDLNKAETILRELISFFPESAHTAAGFVELSQTLDASGNRREALKIASQASQRFLENPEVLINEGELLQRAGDDGEAAKTFLAAVEAGGADPRTLLAAGQAFTRVNELAKARQTFDRLLTDFPTAPEAFEGSIALATVLQKQGQSRAALERLTNLADASAGKPQQISLLLALGDLYGELGFRERAAQQYEDAAAATNDAVVLAKSAVALIDTGNAGPGLAVARRVDASGLPPDLAYDYLSAYGETLLRMDTAMALEKMQQAYDGYPDYRTEEGDRALLGAYLVSGQTARARALVMDLSGYARSHPDSGPRLQRTAIQWADALFSRGDYTAATQAYALAVEAAPEKEDADWARFQQANALLKLDDFGKSLELLDAVAESSSSFAEDARLKAEYVRLEQRLRGEQVPAQLGG